MNKKLIESALQGALGHLIQIGAPTTECECYQKIDAALTELAKEEDWAEDFKRPDDFPAYSTPAEIMREFRKCYATLRELRKAKADDVPDAHLWSCATRFGNNPCDCADGRDVPEWHGWPCVQLWNYHGAAEPNVVTTRQEHTYDQHTCRYCGKAKGEKQS